MNWEQENEKNGLLGDVKSKFRKLAVRFSMTGRTSEHGEVMKRTVTRYADVKGPRLAEA